MTFHPQEGQEVSHDSAAARPRESIGNEAARQPATVIINADDWGRDAVTTDRTFTCHVHEVISSVSAMVFMEDSERAASLARRHDVDAGLHLNFTAPFTAPQCSPLLLKHQQIIFRFLNSHQYARFFYHPGLAASFDYVVHAQLEEFQRLYGAPANRVDGHHHMHLSRNVFSHKLLPAGMIVRRNFTFLSGEVGFLTRTYRSWEDRQLARRYRMTDYFFDLSEVLPAGRQSGLAQILELARSSNVEIETHPMNEEEYRFLLDGGIARFADNVEIARRYLLRPDLHVDQAGNLL
jgi:predicted glycoside hydrolase/deacetylase ChbG (UPF0249 family)